MFKNLVKSVNKFIVNWQIKNIKFLPNVASFCKFLHGTSGGEDHVKTPNKANVNAAILLM